MVLPRFFAGEGDREAVEGAAAAAIWPSTAEQGLPILPIAA
jgi:hypothetical protein